MRLSTVILMLSGFLLPLVGCSYKPVRHLASDAALIKAGESTRQDVLRYLGEPDSRRTVASGIEEYVYSEEQKSELANLPWVGRMVGSRSQETVVVTLNGEEVTACEFRLTREDDQEWKKKTKMESLR
jgi:hypothetical protein